MRIALIDPFFDTSHRRWAEGLQNEVSHSIDVYSGSAHHWKWKMTGGTFNIVEQLNGSNKDFDLLLVTDMLNVPLFKSLLIAKYRAVPVFIYFHENQITYPWSEKDQDVVKNRDHHYGLINLTSAIASEKVIFNSSYHKDSFLNSIPEFSKRFPSNSLSVYVDALRRKSVILPIGLHLPEFTRKNKEIPIFIWNHRWEYDKNPELFFETLFRLQELKVPFQCIVCGKSFQKVPSIFNTASEKLKNEMIHFGHVQSEKKYHQLLKLANVIMVTSRQDFFGISAVEAIASGCYPILPFRLAFPEHVPQNCQDVFYKNDDELEDLAMKVISQKKFMDTFQFSNFVRKYDWDQLRPVYEMVLRDYSSLK